MRTEADFTNYIQNRLADVEIFSDTQSSRVVELDGALGTASKAQNGNRGYPDHIALVDDFVLVMEDKPDRLKLVLRDDGEISQSIDATQNYALNGALFYARKILDGTRYKKIFAFGNAGDRKHHIIQPVFIDAEKNITELPPVETFKNFTAENIDAYWRRMVLKETPPEEIELKKILRRAETLHEYLRSYAQLGEEDKPLVVSGILLALAESRFGFDLNQLTGDKIKTDCAKIFELVENHLKRANVRPEVKRDQILDQFRLIKNLPALNAVNRTLGKTPLRFFTEFIADKIFDAVVNNAAEDYLGRFYGEFISYSGGNGQSLGVVLTPRHITELFCELVDLKPDDVVFDPCCGTGGFLIAAMNHMLNQTDDDEQRKHIRQDQLHGIELRPNMFSTATTNMILRGDGKSNLTCGDFFAHDAAKLQLNGFTVGFMNPPYSQGDKPETRHLSELRFINHLLDSITRGGRVAAIVPVSAMIGKSRYDKRVKTDILRRHTLEGVISLNKNTFYGIGVVPCIAVFTAGEPHPKSKRVKFINFEDDGYEVKKHVGLVETERAKDKKFYLLDCWRGNVKDAPSKFMVETTIEPDDEWLHSFYYYNDELPADKDFADTVADYLTFEFNMISHGRDYLFERKKKRPPLTEPPPLDAKRWQEFFIRDIFDISPGRRLTKAGMIVGTTPFIGASDSNNGVTAFVGNENISADKNILGVNYNGSVVENFYHPYRCIFSDDVKRFRLKNSVGNEFKYLFLKATILQQKSKYTYGYKFNETRMRRQKIMLPVDDEGAPDFEYMAAYIAAIEEKILQRYRDFVANVDAMGGGELVAPLGEKIWRPFFIGDLFVTIRNGSQVPTGAYVKKENLHGGQTPRITVTANNNGISGYCHSTDKNYKVYENFISVSFLGDCFYHPYVASLDMKVHCLKLLDRELNEPLALFLTRALRQMTASFNYGDQLSSTDIVSKKISLPVDNEGAPDFEYMAAFAKNLVANQYRKYLNFIGG